jgi:hypothetical protein
MDIGLWFYAEGWIGIFTMRKIHNSFTVTIKRSIIFVEVILGERGYVGLKSRGLPGIFQMI